MPSTAYVCVGSATVLVAVASPKFHRYVNVSPSGSDDPMPESVHVRAVQIGVAITGTGATFVGGSVKETTRVVLAASPHASVRVSVTV